MPMRPTCRGSIRPRAELARSSAPACTTTTTRPRWSASFGQSRARPLWTNREGDFSPSFASPLDPGSNGCMSHSRRCRRRLRKSRRCWHRPRTRAGPHLASLSQNAPARPSEPLPLLSASRRSDAGRLRPGAGRRKENAPHATHNPRTGVLVVVRRRCKVLRARKSKAFQDWGREAMAKMKAAQIAKAGADFEIVERDIPQERFEANAKDKAAQKAAFDKMLGLVPDVKEGSTLTF